MLTHASARSEPARRGCDHKSAVCNVRTARRLIRPQNVSADNLSILFGNVRVRVRAKPIGERILARHFWIKRAGVTRSNYSMKNIPDRFAIAFSCGANVQHQGKTQRMKTDVRKPVRT